MSRNTDEELLRLVGAKIRELRKAKKLSLQELAYILEMEKSNLSVIENGRSNPQLLTYAKIASALGVNLRDLFDVSFNFESFIKLPVTYKARKHKKDRIDK
ncbi:MAG: helix-turn-helix transcriptional regulator [Flavobacteriales bacterium]|nr:helix-turn-helix transcriptional regulator [Flavobacteriales bacterium]